MRRATKQSNVTYQDFSDFSGGWNCKAAPENIELTELAEVDNMTFSDQPGRLGTRKGIGSPLLTFENSIDGIYAWNDKLIIRADGKLWLMYQEAVEELGDALGEGTPAFCEYDGKVYTCADSQIQEINKEYDLTTIESSYEDTIGLFTKEGRLCCWRSNDEYKDYIYGAYIGDPTEWVVPDSTDDSLQAVEYQIGYKIQGGVVGVVPFLQDLVVFKEKAIMRFVGSLVPGSDDQAVYEVARNERLANKYSYENVGGELFFLDRLSGVRMVAGVDTYGDLLPSEVVPRVNPYIKQALDVDTCRLEHLKYNKIIAFVLGNVIIPAYYDYGTEDMPCLKWTFSGEVKGICETDDKELYIAVDNCLYNMDKELENDEAVSCMFSTKIMTEMYYFLLKRISVDAETTSEFPNSVPTDILCNDTKITEMMFGSHGGTPIYENYYQLMENPDPIYESYTYRTDFVKHQLFRTRKMQITFKGENAAPYILTRFGIEYAPVGVIG